MIEQVLDQANLLSEQLISLKSSPAVSLGNALVDLRLYTNASLREDVIRQETFEDNQIVMTDERDQLATNLDILISQLIESEHFFRLTSRIWKKSFYVPRLKRIK